MSSDVLAFKVISSAGLPPITAAGGGSHRQERCPGPCGKLAHEHFGASGGQLARVMPTTRPQHVVGYCPYVGGRFMVWSFRILTGVDLVLLAAALLYQVPGEDPAGAGLRLGFAVFYAMASAVVLLLYRFVRRRAYGFPCWSCSRCRCCRSTMALRCRSDP
jgi:hypothetical protein